MDLKIEQTNSKVTVSWNNKHNVDLCVVYLKINNVFCEIARTFGDAFTTLSLLPYGENEIFVRAFKNGQIVDETPIEKFKYTTIDIAAVLNNKKNKFSFLYSKHPNAENSRLYKNQKDSFVGLKNVQSNLFSLDLQDIDSTYKIKPYCTINGERKFLASSEIFTPKLLIEKHFECITLYKSYLDNLFLSWVYEGYADGYLIYNEYSSQPIYEISDSKCNYVTLKGYKQGTGFKICAFVNSPYGKVIVEDTEYVKIKNRNYSHPEVSLIVPAYNSQNYIARSIDSALASNFDDLEIIIVNDGSSDNTQEIMEWYSKNYPNVKAVYKENSGAADTRNLGIKIANGRYIAFMDSDDLIHPNMINLLYNSITKNSCDIAISPLYKLSNDGYTTHCNLPFEENVSYNTDKYLNIMYTHGFCNCAIWNKLYRGELVKQHPLEVIKFEDNAWTPYIVSWAQSFCVVNKPLYIWDRRIRPEETFGQSRVKLPERVLFENRTRAMQFYIENGNPSKKNYLKDIQQRHLSLYSRFSKKGKELYLDLIEKIKSEK